MIMKGSLNSDGHQFHQYKIIYQQNEQSSLIITELTENKSRSWFGTDTKMWWE